MCRRQYKKVLEIQSSLVFVVAAAALVEVVAMIAKYFAQHETCVQYNKV